jgi:acyl-CoA hydrolase
VVTASMDDLHFHVPVKVGWTVTLRARVLATFHTSMEVGVTVTAEDPLTGARQLATSALLTFVALDATGKKTLVPALDLQTDEERVAFQEAQARRTERLARKDQGKTWVRILRMDDSGPGGT